MPVPTPPVLWRPAPDAHTTTRLGGYFAWLERERGLAFEDYDALLAWSTDEIGPFWQSVWDHFAVRFDDGYGAGPGRRGHAGRALVRRSATQLRRACAAARRPRRRGRRGHRAFAVARPPHAHEARAARRPWPAPAPACSGSASAAATASPPTCRTSPRRSSRSSPPPASARSGRRARRSSGRGAVVDRFAQIEPKVLLAVDGYRYGERDRRPDRAEVAAIRAALPSLAATVVRAVPPARRRRVPATRHLGRAASAEPRPARVRAGAVRPPALRALQLGHDRPAEADRARPRRHPRSST